jgi:hypothetical protein
MNHYYPTLALPPGSTDVFVFWNEMNGNQDNWGLYGQKINAAGALQWGNNGMTFIPVTGTNVYPYEARATPTDMVLFYEEYATTVAGKIKAMRISTTGSFVWSPSQKEVCSVISEKVHPVINEFANNQWILAWEDNRSSDKDIYAQNIQLDGTLGPANSGTISGVITLNGGGGNVTQVLVKAGTTTTYPDPTGFYSMTVPTGTYTVTASLAGYQTATQNNVIVSNNQTTTVNLTLNPFPVGYITGHVTLNGGTGVITQVVVTAGTISGNPDMSGNYTLIVPPGTYDVIATHSGYYADTVNAVLVANQQTTSGVNLVLNPMPVNGQITGIVTLNGGTGLITQVLVSAGGGVATTNPNASGFYTLTLPAGNYDVTASLSGYAAQTISGVAVVVSQTTPNVNFTLSPLSSSGTIQGTVVITGAPADVTQATVTAGAYYANPDITGNYSITVPPGTYNVMATHPYTNSVTNQNILVSNGQTTNNVNFMLTVDKADMVVKATNWGQPIYNVDVVIQGPGGPYTGTIISDSLVFLHVPYGYYDGIATLSSIFSVNSDTTVSAVNHHLIFEFNIEGVAEQKSAPVIAILPNPANRESIIRCTLPMGGKWAISLTAINGMQFCSTVRNCNQGNNIIVLKEVAEMTTLPDGLYILELRSDSGAVGRCKLMYRNGD